MVFPPRAEGHLSNPPTPGTKRLFLSCSQDCPGDSQNSTGYCCDHLAVSALVKADLHPLLEQFLNVESAVGLVDNTEASCDLMLEVTFL